MALTPGYSSNFLDDAGDKKWKDGDLYLFVYDGGKALAHAYNPSIVGRDITLVKDADGIQYAESLHRTAVEKGEGCVKFKFPNPAKGGQIESKVGYAMKLDKNVWVGSGTYLINK